MRNLSINSTILSFDITFIRQITNIQNNQERKGHLVAGIFGIAFDDSYIITHNTLERMETFLRHRPSFVSDKYFYDDKIAAGRCHTGIINTRIQPSVQDDVFVWLDGEIYNHEELPVKAAVNEDAELFLKNYIADPSMNFLSKTDGIFTAVIYDRNRKKISLCTDRYGLQHIYWLQTKNSLAWSSEYKAFLALPDFDPVIDAESVNAMLKYGYLTGNSTWFENVQVLAPATLLQYDLQSRQTKSQKYWRWDRIKKTEASSDIRGICEEWGRLFSRAVIRRSRENEKTGITLSGGLDSRAILAAMPQYDYKIQAFTFGIKDCDDIRIAAKASEIKGAEHNIKELDMTSWLRTNIASVWCTDGEMCFLDTNGNEFLSDFSRKMKICLNGIAGDAIHGGSYLGMTSQHAIESDDPYGDRGRRYIRPGFRLDEAFYHVRMPFYDNSLIELMMSLPDNLRAKSFIYNKILLYNYNEYFRNIPWQKSGVPISYPHLPAKAISFVKRAGSRMLRMADKYGFPIKDKRNYISSTERTLTETGKKFFTGLFNNKNALYTEYVNKNVVLSTWEKHLTGKYDTDAINRYATLEIWLQQAFKKNLRPDMESFPVVSIWQ
jgi:asparagine synthase (glutamine-hydrolysing)